MPTQINAFRSEDGSIHLTEGAALRADVLHLLQLTAKEGDVPPELVLLISDHGLAVIEQCLGRLLPLLNRLSDPRNKAPQPEQPKKPAPVVQEASIEAPRAETLADADPHSRIVYVDEEYPAIDPSELRVGQLALVHYPNLDGNGEVDSFMAVITDVDENGMVTFLKQDTPKGWQQPCDPSFIARIVHQPEDMLLLEPAKEELAKLPSDPDMTTSEGRLAHTRRILLLRRIAQLENEDATS